MANGKADGEIRIETAVDSKGFQAGCDSLMRAINSLAKKTNTVGKAIRNTFNQPLEVNVDTSSAEGKFSAIKARAKQVKEEINKIEAKSQIKAPTAKVSDTPLNTNGLKKQIDSLVLSVERLDPAFQKALSGNEKAISG
ncbi:MAG: hypothetical protein Q4D20_10475, partial [Clostridia bacterium]|nr:hypothetical protein [Clostridia bacterium]